MCYVLTNTVFNIYIVLNIYIQYIQHLHSIWVTSQKYLCVFIDLPCYSICAAKRLNKQPPLFVLSLWLVVALHQKFGSCENWSFYDISPEKVITLLL